MRIQLSDKHLKEFAPVIDHLVAEKVSSRIAALDSHLWGEAAQPEASIRLGWVDAWTESRKLLPAISNVSKTLNAAGVTRFMLCGMGGSSLAPEVLAIYKNLPLEVLDSTNPDQISGALAKGLDNLAVFVSSKSGTTVETTSQFKLFQEKFLASGIDPIERIIVITDPGSALDIAARKDGFQVFNADPNIGGRYSALSAFGIVPAALAGFDVTSLLDDAEAIISQLSLDTVDNPALLLGAFLASTPNIGLAPISKETIALPAWIEQLIAESTGKEGKGILPIALEPNAPELSSRPSDIKVAGLEFSDSSDSALLSNNQYDALVSGSIAEQFVIWEWATVIASFLIGINPFDQPDVESAKIAARQALAAGVSSLPAPHLSNPKINDLENHLQKLLNELGSDGYLSIQAYLDRKELAELEKIRPVLAKITDRPVTFGWGPRFLHSTGQFHKGGPKRGVFLQITAKSGELAIPGGDTTFNALITSQASGDRTVLETAGLPVLSIFFDNPKDSLELLVAASSLNKPQESNGGD
ncbi:MAG: glucose-6-phosphate isomerase [Microbacteriaceae bacterium]|nr:glucose-6-phosphate isomerase [Microbacteriaceae bacterium]